MNARVVHHPANTLGEGILWCEREQALYWADIQAAALWRHRPADGACPPLRAAAALPYAV